MLVAENILRYKSVVGTLGDGGTLFPQYFMWSRPVYPLFILIVDTIIHNLVTSAQLVALLAGITTIPLTFILAKQVLQSNKLALLASLFVAVSFNHSIWSGFIMSDTVGIACLTLFFISLFRTIGTNSKFLETNDLLTGGFFGLSIFARYEYILYIIPVFVLLYIKRKITLLRVANLLLGFLLVGSILFFALFPIEGTFLLLQEQIPDILKVFLVSIIGFLLFFKLRLKIPYFLISKLFFVLLVFLFVVVIFRIPIPFTQGFLDFLKTDSLLVLLSLFGISKMVLSKEHKHLGIFFTIGFLIFELMYLRINPLQQRYTTHLLPIFAISAAYAFKNINLSKITISLLVILLGAQAMFSYQGMKSWSEGDWYRQSYEEVSAKRLIQYLKDDDVLLVAFPESYYFFTQRPTQSITINSPYFYLNHFSDEQNIVIVNDMAMRDIFPKVSEFVSRNLVSYKVGEYFTQINYHYKNYSKVEDSPVIVYRIKLGDVKRYFLTFH